MLVRFHLLGLVRIASVVPSSGNQMLRSDLADGRVTCFQNSRVRPPAFQLETLFHLTQPAMRLAFVPPRRIFACPMRVHIVRRYRHTCTSACSDTITRRFSERKAARRTSSRYWGSASLWR